VVLGVETLDGRPKVIAARELWEDDIAVQNRNAATTAASKESVLEMSHCLLSCPGNHDKIRDYVITLPTIKILTPLAHDRNDFSKGAWTTQSKQSRIYDGATETD
jgi:hypothetical protein